MFTIFTPSKRKLTAGDDISASVLLATQMVQDSLATAVQACSGSGDVIVSRSQASDRPDLQRIEISFFDRFDQIDMEQVHTLASEWARRSNVRGISGDRVACVSPLTAVPGASGPFDTYTMTADVSTTVFYNARRATVNFPDSLQEFELDVASLVSRLESVGAVGSDAGITISHPEFGNVTYGDSSAAPLEDRVTDIRAAAGRLSSKDPAILESDLRALHDLTKALLADISE
jgi:hypothetical protein